ncbi:hypothetical protein [uncultured Maricaulis sp.]|uniref:sodium:solute symporter family transporter n=1 Tax=uncultured Maricaulis sp. TaxID=174710 RepID=UPI0030DA6AE7|tara:strand:- start:28200 stop:29600 length:1401 start_codon:yes stop_codon:yes gene_type:complete
MVTLVLLVALALVITIGFFASRATANTAQSYFIGDRSLGPIQTALSASATANTGFVVIGAVGMGYSMGLTSITYSLAWLAGDIVYWFFVAERINRVSRDVGAVTVVDIVEKKGGGRLLSVVISMLIVVMLTIYTSAQFTAAGKVLEGFFHIESFAGVLVGLLVVLAYTLFGGFRASVWTDVLQAIFMFALAFGSLVWVVVSFGGVGVFSEYLGAVGSGYADITGGRSTLNFILFMVGFAFAGFGFNLSQPQVTTRIMACRDAASVGQAKWLYIFSLHSVWISMCFIGMGANGLLAPVADPELALPALAQANFNEFFAAAVLVGMFAAILSSVDSLLISTSSSIAVDILQIKHGTAIYRALVAFVGIAAAVISVYLSATVFQASLLAATILAASIGPVVFISVFNFRRSSTSMLISLIGGLSSALMWRHFALDGIISDSIVGFTVAILLNGLIAPKHSSDGELDGKH